MNAILSIVINSLDAGCVFGTVLMVHRVDFKPNWGDEAAFLFVKVSGLTDDAVADIRIRKLKLDLGRFMSPKTQEKYLQNKIKYYDAFVREQAIYGHVKAEKMHKNMYESFGTRPDFTKVVSLKPDFFLLTPADQWIKPVDIDEPRASRR